jgi:hypothetical protein
MPNTYTLINSYTVGSGGISQIDFTSIPSTYTDLLVKTSSNTNTNTILRIRFNSVSSSDYTQKVLRGTGSATASYSNAGWDTLTNFSPSYNDDASNTFSNNQYYIPNYTSSDAKSLSGDSVTEANSTTAFQILYAGLLNNTSTITSMSFFSETGVSFNQYSTFRLYGIKNS